MRLLTRRGGTLVGLDAIALAADFKFNPATISAPGNSSVTVTIKNDQRVEHDFSVTELGVEKDVEKGETATVTFTTKDNATLTWYHRASNGMKGTLTVGSGGAGGGTSPGGAAAAPSY